jgi:hypothetical protein
MTASADGPRATTYRYPSRCTVSIGLLRSSGSKAVGPKIGGHVTSRSVLTDALADRAVAAEAVKAFDLCRHVVAVTGQPVELVEGKAAERRREGGRER